MVVSSSTYYPLGGGGGQVMKSVYIINAPWVFSAIFNLIKGFLDPSTQKKIQVRDASPLPPCRCRHS